MVFNINNFKRIYKSKITFTLAAKNAEKLTFLLISQARVNKLYIFQQCTTLSIYPSQVNLSTVNPL
jgi:hypothetical protein